jgi:hypothetical protein
MEYCKMPDRNTPDCRGLVINRIPVAVRSLVCLVIVVAAGLNSCTGPGDSGPGNGDGNGNANGDNAAAFDPDVAAVTAGERFRPDVDATWQWQLQPGASGKLNTDYDVEVYDLDLVDTPQEVIDDLHVQGRAVICYFSAGTYESFRDDADQFPASALGKPLEDHPTERWLDVRDGRLRQIMDARLDLAVAKQCDGVEPDNVDGYANDSGFALTDRDQLAYNRYLANAARQRGLSVGLKNDLDQVPALVDYFDFAVNEECHEYEECDTLAPFIDAGKPVFSAEYADEYVNNTAARAEVCASAANLNIRTLILPLDLDDSFRISCDE